MSVRFCMLENQEQAVGVAALFREVYGQSYPVSLYYQPGELWNEHQAGRLHSAVGLDVDGSVVSHCALYSSAPNPRLLEAGAGLVHPRARRDGVFSRTFAVALSFAQERELCDWIVTEAVCNHVATQKLASRYGFVDTALEIDLMPAAAYTREASAQGRVSTLLSFLPLQDQGGGVCLPTRYRHALLEIYGRLGVRRQMSASPLPTAAVSRVTMWRNEVAGLLRVTVHELGEDLEDYLADSAEVMQLLLPLDSEGLDRALVRARARGFFLAGLLPAWSGADNLMLQRLSAPIDWEQIALETDSAHSLMSTLKDDLIKAMEEKMTMDGHLDG